MTKSNIAHVIGLTAVAISALAVATSASAQTTDDQTSVRVSFRDLDIGHAAGAAVLRNRIEAAAARVCGNFDNLDFDRIRAVERCRTETVTRAMDQLATPRTTAVADRADPRLTSASR